MTRNRNPDQQLRHELNQRAWAEAYDRAKYYYDTRRAELFIAAGLPPPNLPPGPQQRARAERTRRFLEFIKDLLADDDIANNDDFLDAITPFLQDPTTTKRIALTITLKNNPQWLGDRLAQFQKFA